MVRQLHLIGNLGSHSTSSLPSSTACTHSHRHQHQRRGHASELEESPVMGLRRRAPAAYWLMVGTALAAVAATCGGHGHGDGHMGASLLSLGGIHRALGQETTDGICFSGATPLIMTPPQNDKGEYICGLGYNCPNFDPSNKATWPVYCTPDPACIIDRAFGKPCERNSNQEPAVCEQGNYCPTATEVIQCPKNYYCPYAAYKPTKCPPLSICPAGSYQLLYLGGLVASVILFIAFIVVLVAYRNYLRYSTLSDDFENASNFLAAFNQDPSLSCRQRDANTYGDEELTAIMPDERVANGRNGANGSTSSAPAAGGSVSSPMGDVGLHSRSGGGGSNGGGALMSRSTVTATSTSGSSYITDGSVGADTVTVDGKEEKVAKRKKAIQVLAGGFLMARSTKPLTYEIKDMQVWAPQSKASSRKGQTYGKAAKEERQRLKEERREAGDASGGGPLAALSAFFKEPKGRIPILQGVTATFRPSTVTAILGPGGSGKSTLLNALLGRLPAGWEREGYVAVNGDDSPDVTQRLKGVIGSATQQEPLHRELTVYQNLFYSSQVRLPRQWSLKDKDTFLAATIEALQLVPQKDVVIGDEEQRGVSGGQRRRCHIGIEIAAAPYALFLDEPTNGLDATTALEVCSCLSSIATEAGLTVVITISQPRLEIWEALDNIIVIAKGGRTAYQGPRAESQHFFEEYYGVYFSSNGNPSDIIVDAVAARGPALADMWEQYCDDPEGFKRANGKDAHRNKTRLMSSPDAAPDFGTSDPNAPIHHHHKKKGGKVAFAGAPDGSATGSVRPSAFDRSVGDAANGSSSTAHPMGSPKDPRVTGGIVSVASPLTPSSGAVRGGMASSSSSPRIPRPSQVQRGNAPDDFDDDDGDAGGIRVGPNNNSFTVGGKVQKRKGFLCSREHKSTEIVITRRNATFLHQVFIVFRQSIAKQLSDLQPFIVEQLVNVVVSAAIGISSTQYNPYWTWLFYPLVSPSENQLLPQIFMYLSMALGVVCVMPGAAIIVNSRETYFREASAGFNRFAYYLGVVISLQPRIILTTLIFTTLFLLIPRLAVDFGKVFLANWFIAECSYAIGIIPAMIFSAASAPLVGTLGVIFFSCLSGFIDKFPLGLKYLSYSYWGTSMLQRFFQEPVSHAYADMADQGQWISDDIPLCIGILVVILFIFHTIGFCSMVFMHRAKQR